MRCQTAAHSSLLCTNHRQVHACLPPSLVTTSPHQCAPQRRLSRRESELLLSQPFLSVVSAQMVSRSRAADMKVCAPAPTRVPHPVSRRVMRASCPQPLVEHLCWEHMPASTALVRAVTQGLESTDLGDQKPFIRGALLVHLFAWCRPANIVCH